MKITYEDVVFELEDALKTFGTYQYEDKGADEVMDVYGIVSRFAEQLTAEEEMVILKQLITHKHGVGLVNSILQWSENYDDKHNTHRLDELDAVDIEFVMEHY